MAIERMTADLPGGFDPSKHAQALVAMVVAKHGERWELESIDPADSTATLTRQVALTEVTAAQPTSRKKSAPMKQVNLPRGTKPSDGDKISARFEDQHPGFYLTSFEPFLGRAELTKLSDEVARCRGALALALSVKPWEVQVGERPDGGFHVALPRTYVPSKHNDKMDEVATVVVGQEGWYVDIDTRALTAQIIPSDPPTFPETLATPIERLGKDPDRSTFGLKLPKPGQEFGEPMTIDWTMSAFALIAGTPGSGKSVTLNCLIGDALAGGAQLVVVDEPAKAVDFMWCKDFVRDGGWGCDSDKAAVATLAMVYQEGQRRAKVLADSGYVNWLDMPPGKRFQPIFIVVDELSALLVTDKIPSGIPKTHPLVQEATERNLMKIQLASLIGKIIAEQRFVGMRMVLSTQVTNNNTGVPPSLRAKIGHKVLQGSNPSKSARAQAFSDESAVPVVPANVLASGKRARGVGASDLEGDAPAIYKSYFASINDYREFLDSRSIPTTSRPAPTANEIAKHTPSLDDEGFDERPPSRLDSGGFGAGDGRDAPDVRLRGAAAAAHQLAVEAAEAKRGEQAK